LRIGFFDPYLEQAGGGERYLLTMLAEAQRLGHEVVLLSPAPPDALALQRVTGELAWDEIRWKMAEDATVRTASATLGLLVVLHNDIPPASRAARNWLVLQFPFKRLPYHRVTDALDPRNAPRFLKRRARLQQFERVLCYSSYTRRHIQERLHISDPVVLPPPVPLPAELPSVPRERAIVAVGRFFRGGHNKRHAVLIDAFRRLVEEMGSGAGWQLRLVGGATDTPETAAYLAELEAQAAGLAVELHPNASARELAALYDSSMFLWHAAGHGADAAAEPERLEHFGIVVAEAMGHGCIPLAFAGGGVVEIIRSGKDGVLWTTVPQLVDATRNLIEDPAQRATLRRCGAERAEQFSEARFRRRVGELLAGAETRP